LKFDVRLTGTPTQSIVAEAKSKGDGVGTCSQLIEEDLIVGRACSIVEWFDGLV